MCDLIPAISVPTFSLIPAVPILLWDPVPVISAPALFLVPAVPTLLWDLILAMAVPTPSLVPAVPTVLWDLVHVTFTHLPLPAQSKVVNNVVARHKTSENSRD